MNVSAWIQAARLRTLPLAIATMSVGHALAHEAGSMRWDIFGLSLFTAISLQILSNLANDYGDSIHGADHEGREGPSRAVQSGAISVQQMRNAAWFMAGVSMIGGTFLVLAAFTDWLPGVIFWLLGCVAVWAAYNYTAGDKPYGYQGKGDIAVFIFFGLVTVIGAYYLQIQHVDLGIILPAISCGTLSVAVLNVNNIRDIHSDQEAGKESIPVQIGRDAAVRYHGILLLVSVGCLIGYNVLRGTLDWPYWLFLVCVPLLVVNYRAVQRFTDAQKLDPYLRQLAISSALMLLLFAAGRVF